MTTLRNIDIAGEAGLIEVAVDPAGEAYPSPLGHVLVAHPHPLFGGTRDNKVVQSVARAFCALGYECWRPNFRGVGRSQGIHDAGIGETQDLLRVIGAMSEKSPGKPLILAGFSFGCFVQSRVLAALIQAQVEVGRLVLVAPAVSRFEVGRVPPNTLVIHGEIDDVVSMSAVIDWARPQNLPLVVVPGADHFFHRKLTIIKNTIFQHWGRPDLCLPTE